LKPATDAVDQLPFADLQTDVIKVNRTKTTNGFGDVMGWYDRMSNLSFAPMGIYLDQA